MNRPVMQNIFLLIVICLLVVNILLTLKQKSQVKNVLKDLQAGGVGLVEHIDKLILMQSAMERGEKTDSLVFNDLVKHFEIYPSVDNKKGAFIAIAKSDHSIVYYVDRDDIIYYDKINYLLREELKVGYRLKFEEWLHNQN